MLLIFGSFLQKSGGGDSLWIWLYTGGPNTGGLPHSCNRRSIWQHPQCSRHVVATGTFTIPDEKGWVQPEFAGG